MWHALCNRLDATLRKCDALVKTCAYGHQEKSERRLLLLYTNKAKLSGLGPLSSLLQLTHRKRLDYALHFIKMTKANMSS